MMHRISRVQAGRPPTLTLWWLDGSHTKVSLEGVIAIGGELGDLADPHVFGSAKVTPDGRAVVFDRLTKEPIDLCADALWRMSHGETSVAAE